MVAVCYLPNVPRTSDTCFSSDKGASSLSYEMLDVHTHLSFEEEIVELSLPDFGFTS